MKSFIKLAALAASLCAASIFSIGGTYAACTRKGAEILGDAMDQGMHWYYTGFGDQVGQFPGKLVCVQADKAIIDAAGEEGEASHDVFALSMDRGSMEHPIIPGTSQVRHELRSDQFLGRRVVVQGKYYRDTGMILASRILPASKMA
jgi:hypothetical protein